MNERNTYDIVGAITAAVVMFALCLAVVGVVLIGLVWLAKAVL